MAEPGRRSPMHESPDTHRSRIAAPPATEPGVARPSPSQPTPAADVGPPRTTSRPESRFLRLFPALSDGNFRLFWLGMLPSMMGYQMGLTVNGYAAFQLTGAATPLGL